MKKHILLLGTFCLFLSLTFAQTATDSIQLIHDRNVLVKNWEESKTILSEDSLKQNMINALKSASDLINMDENVAREYISEYLKSRSTQKTIQEVTTQSKGLYEDLKKAHDFQLLLIIGIIVLFLILLVFLILFIVFLVKSAKLKKAIKLIITEGKEALTEIEIVKKENKELISVHAIEIEALKKINLDSLNKNKELEAKFQQEKDSFENNVSLLKKKESDLLEALKTSKSQTNNNQREIQLSSEKNSLEQELQRYKSLYTQELEQGRKISTDLQELERIQDQLLEKYEQELKSKEIHTIENGLNYKDQYELLLTKIENVQTKNTEFSSLIEQEKNARLQIENDLRQLLKDLGGK